VWINYFQASNTLIPVYEFITDTEKQREVRAYYNSYFESKRIVPEKIKNPVTGIYYINAQTSNQPVSDEKFVTNHPTAVVGGALDLNAGAGGDYIYVV
jgi:hypothetical protein